MDKLETARYSWTNQLSVSFQLHVVYMCMYVIHGSGTCAHLLTHTLVQACTHTHTHTHSPMTFYPCQSEVCSFKIFMQSCTHWRQAERPGSYMYTHTHTVTYTHTCTLTELTPCSFCQLSTQDGVWSAVNDSVCLLCHLC